MASPRCPSCTELGTLTCTGCKNVKYCSTSCQQTDWQFHKVLCKSFKEFEIRPSQDMRRVIYFPADQAKPEFRWLPLRRLMDDDGRYEVAQSIDYETLVGEGFLKTSPFNRNNLIDATLDVVIDLCYDDDFLLKYSENNKAAMLATNRKMGHSWRGPIVAYCGHVATGSWVPEIVRVTDTDMKTYSDLVAHLIDYANDSHTHQLRKGPKIKAVKTNCIGEQRVNRMPFAQTVELPRMHPIFDTGDTSAISKNIGIPLLLMKDTRKKYPEAPKDWNGPTDYCNEKVTFMQMACDPYSEFNEEGKDSFGWAPPHWLGGQVPNVLVARLDREPLEPDVVAAFGDFCQYHLQPYFQWQQDSQLSSASNNAACKQIVMKQMAPENWSKYLMQWRNKRSGSVSDLAEGINRMGLDEREKETVKDYLFDEEGKPRVIEAL